MSGRLAVRYGWLLRAYPKGRRRIELLDTLMEAAPPERSRPTPREAVNLLRHGMRARLGRPRSRGVVVLAVLISLVTGFAVASAAQRVAWAAAPGYPSGAALRHLNETIYPGLDADGVRNGDGLFFDVSEPSAGSVFLRGHDEDFAFSTLDLAPYEQFVNGDYRSWTDAARERLRRDGWTVDEVSPTGATDIATGALEESGRAFYAHKGGLGIDFSAETDVVDTPTGHFSTIAVLDRLTPWWITMIALLGLLAGALGGWLVTGWVSRRTEGAGGRVRSLTREPAVIALILLLPQTLLGFVLLGYDSWSGHPPGQPAWYLFLTYGFGCTWFGGLLLALPVVIAALTGRPARGPVEAL